MLLLRRLVAAFLLALLAGAVPAHAQRAADAPRLAEQLDPRQRHAESLLVVHYHRPDGKYEGWNLWSWPEGGDGAAFAFDGADIFGRYAIVPFPKSPGRAGFIVRRGNWEEKDFDQDRFVDLKPGAVAEIWIVSGDDAVRTDPKAIDLSLRVVGAFLDAADRITLATTVPLSQRQLRGISVTVGASTIEIRSIRPAPPSGGKQVYDVLLDHPVAANDVAHLSLVFEERIFDDMKPQRVIARDVLDDERFQALNASLGAACSAASTTFTTWSPVADAIELLLDGPPGAVPPAAAIALKREANGVWRTSVAGDLHGRTYRYRITAYGSAREVPDIHCFAATADSSRSVVIDLTRIEPDGFRAVPAPTLARPTDEILYELHVRDYSIRDSSCPPAQRGTYLGLIHEHQRDSTGASSGLSHLVDLGITAVHLLPVHDFTAKPDEYNWGYWTTLFNVPESNYATDRADPTSAIRDLRTAITGLHRAGIRVILDVVYNHTSSAGPDSPFDATVPSYFFRTTRDGRLVNDTGVGNTIADERPMMRKFIVDSLRHWLRDYRVDGFRFDLLGSHEPSTVRAICDALVADRADVTLYGEPWTAGGTTRFGKGAQKGMPIAVFNDHLRNAIRGDLDGSTVGFATGPGGDSAAVRSGVAGAIDDFALKPRESVNYASAHDNLSLWDKIVKTQPGASDAERRSMQRLALGIVLTSQGIALIHGGCDFCRTKQGRHNTFDLGDDINQFDWSRKAEYADVFEFVAGLVHIRRAHPAFRLADDADVRKALAFVDGGRDVAFTLDGRVAHDSWNRILVAYNDEPAPRTLSLPSGEWTVVVDATHAGTAPLAVVRGSVTLPPYSMILAHAD